MGLIYLIVTGKWELIHAPRRAWGWYATPKSQIYPSRRASGGFVNSRSAAYDDRRDERQVLRVLDVGRHT